MSQTSGSSDLGMLFLFILLGLVVAKATRSWTVEIDPNARRLIITGRLFHIWPTFTAHWFFDECSRIWAGEHFAGDGERRVSVYFELGERGAHVVPVHPASLALAAKLADEISILTGILRGSDEFQA
ncbi:hypothetical protein [Bradyrhizobium sp. ORS 285]|uniref:hypothetical protein n=1 Tax=Bradyrhizobium sp. ORS 285 TaxID=115808 RepID=UPI0002EA7415|nr:hypothetical protein [Bradyrhizobium sp. ORS 285]